MTADRILLIGGAGFLGTAMARRLAEQGRPVAVLTRRDVAPWAANIRVIKGDMRDAAVLGGVLPGCGTVVHLAATTTPGITARRPALEADEMIVPTLRMLEALQEVPPAHLIFFSSGGTVYGNPAQLPVTEESPIAPLSYHGAAKAAVEIFLRVFALRTGIPVTILRPGNVYGPGQALRQGFGVVRTMLEHARAGSAMEIWGDGETVRDYLYVDDLVDACRRLIDLPGDGGIYNLGSGTGCSLSRLREIVTAVTGRELAMNFVGERPADVRGIVLDSSRLAARTGWRPQVALEEGIRRTWHWLSAP